MARSFGRVAKPSGAKPAAIAPEETTNTSLPDFFNAATTSTSASTAFGSNCPPDFPVSEEEPIFITIR